MISLRAINPSSADRPKARCIYPVAYPDAGVIEPGKTQFANGCLPIGQFVTYRPLAQQIIRPIAAALIYRPVSKSPAWPIAQSRPYKAKTLIRDFPGVASLKTLIRDFPDVTSLKALIRVFPGVAPLETLIRVGARPLALIRAQA